MHLNIPESLLDELSTHWESNIFKEVDDFMKRVDYKEMTLDELSQYIEDNPIL